MGSFRVVLQKGLQVVAPSFASLVKMGSTTISPFCRSLPVMGPSACLCNIVLAAGHALIGVLLLPLAWSC